jgi:exodeoxyribonuclease III
MELEAAGYQAVHHSAGRWAGVAIAAPAGASVTDVAAGLEGEPARDEARWLEATVDGVRVVTVHVPNGRAVDTPPYVDKLRFLEAMASRLGSLSPVPLVVAGDFNVCPTGP